VAGGLAGDAKVKKKKKHRQYASSAWCYRWGKWQSHLIQNCLPAFPTGQGGCRSMSEGYVAVSEHTQWMSLSFCNMRIGETYGRILCHVVAL
jgi:hypothetical protein